MTSLDKTFEELRQRLKSGRGLSHSGDDPVYYLIFAPQQMLQVKLLTSEWLAKLRHEDWQPEVLSMAELIHGILENHPLRSIWLEAEKDDPLDFRAVNATLREALTSGDPIKKRIQEKLESLAGREKTILFLTDLEALHPYLRVGTLEQKLQGRFTVPTVILYPGVRTGKSTLKFLGIYPEDGNYRSVHVGG